MSLDHGMSYQKLVLMDRIPAAGYLMLTATSVRPPSLRRSTNPFSSDLAEISHAENSKCAGAEVLRRNFSSKARVEKDLRAQTFEMLEHGVDRNATFLPYDTDI